MSTHGELAGYRALYLLHRLADTRIAAISTERWRRWLAVVVWFPLEVLILNDGHKEHHEQTQALQLELLRIAFEKLPQAFLNDIRYLVIANDGREQDLVKFQHLWDAKLESMLLALLREEALSPMGQRSLLDFLLRQGCEEASNYADERILESVFATIDPWSRSRIVCRAKCLARQISTGHPYGMSF